MSGHKKVPGDIEPDELHSGPAVYVLQCEGDNFYVGATTNLFRRIAEHVSGNGSNWTDEHPVVDIVETRRVDDNLLQAAERGVTERYMKKHGIDSVRGSIWAAVDLDNCPPIPDDVVEERNADMDSLSSIAKTYCSD